MDSSVLLAALFWGGLSAVSLPLGSLIGLWTRPERRVTSALMAFGGGALLFALTIELFGHVLHVAGDGHGHILKPWLVLAAIGAAVVGGLAFNGMNMVLEGHGGFLRRRTLIRRHVTRRRRSQARKMLRSLAKVEYFRGLPPEEVIRLIPDVQNVDFPEGDNGLQSRRRS